MFFFAPSGWGTGHRRIRDGLPPPQGRWYSHGPGHFDQRDEKASHIYSAGPQPRVGQVLRLGGKREYLEA